MRGQTQIQYNLREIPFSITDSTAKRYNVLVWMHKYSVAKTPHGKHQLLVLRLQGDVPIPHPCGASLSPRPWGSPPSAASPRRVFLPCSVDGSCIFMHPNRVFAVESSMKLVKKKLHEFHAVVNIYIIVLIVGTSYTDFQVLFIINEEFNSFSKNISISV